MANIPTSYLTIGDDVLEIVDAVARRGAVAALTPATTASEMTDTSKLYLYLGTETGYEYGYVYANINGTWTKTTIFGAGKNGNSLDNFEITQYFKKSKTSTNPGTSGYSTTPSLPSSSWPYLWSYWKIRQYINIGRFPNEPISVRVEETNTRPMLVGAYGAANNVRPKRLFGVDEIVEATDYNSLIDVSEYFVSAENISLVTNAPTNKAHRLTVENLLGIGSGLRQTVRSVDSDEIFTRRSSDGGTTWTDWVSYLPNKISPISGIVVNSTNAAMVNSYHLYKLNRMGFFEIVLNGKMTAGSWLTMVTLPTNCRPLVQSAMAYKMDNRANGSKIMQATIQSDGKVFVYLPVALSDATNIVRLTCSFVTAN